MDPISLIVAALVAGAAGSAEETAKQAVKDAYQGLKGVLGRLFRNKPEAEAALEQAEEQPAEAEEALREALAGAGADRDAEAVAAAQRVLELVDPEGAAAGKFRVAVAGDVQGQVVGDHATVTMNFGDPPTDG